MFNIYEVGGCVRDGILGLQSKDIDYAVETSSFSQMREEMLAQRFKIFLESPQFLTIRAKFPDSKLVADFVLCRKESAYTNGRHPDLVEPGTINEDLARRDFTVNAIAKCIKTGKLIDPHNGVTDLKNGILRAVRNPDERFSEDGLRVLRALRFCITKNLEIEHNTWMAIHRFNPSLLNAVSTDRKREELNKMFCTDSIKSMELILDLPRPLQEAIFSDGIWLKATTESR
jgi:tRNA nucleotidyltransferase (CCA-adding enzyme)